MEANRYLNIDDLREHKKLAPKQAAINRLVEETNSDPKPFI
jgi:hypothetical protein